MRKKAFFVFEKIIKKSLFSPVFGGESKLKARS